MCTELQNYIFICFTQMGLSLPVPVSSPWTIQDHSFLLIGATEPIRYRVRIRHWCSRANQIQGLVSFLKYPRPFLPSYWCSRTNQIQGKKILGYCLPSHGCRQTNQIQGENPSLVQPSQSDSSYSLFFLKYSRPFLSSDWCSRTNQMQSEKLVVSSYWAI
jgi:hypothetical protein